MTQEQRVDIADRKNVVEKLTDEEKALLRQSDLLWIEEMSEQGVLWAINRYIFHPRGFALTIHVHKDTQHGFAWSLLGDGSETYRFEDEFDEQKRQAFEAFLEDHRP